MFINEYRHVHALFCLQSLFKSLNVTFILRDFILSLQQFLHQLCTLYAVVVLGFGYLLQVTF